MDGIENLRHRGDLFLRVLGEQDNAKELALGGIMAKKYNDADDYSTGGRPPKDDQMKAMVRVHGKEKPQSQEPPYIGQEADPGEKG